MGFPEAGSVGVFVPSTLRAYASFSGSLLSSLAARQYTPDMHSCDRPSYLVSFYFTFSGLCGAVYIPRAAGSCESLAHDGPPLSQDVALGYTVSNFPL